MNELMRTRTTKEWFDLFDEHGVMYAPVNNIEDVAHDPHVLERDMIVEAPHPRVGNLKFVGIPMKFSRTPCRIERACPDLGEHTVEILSNLVGLSEKEIQELEKSKAI